MYTAIFFLFTIMEDRVHRKKEKLTLPEVLPTVCVIVPCYNEEMTVVKTIKTLLDLSYPKDKLEIIVVDDGSTDKTYEKAQSLKNPQVKVFRKKNGGKYTALNYALKRTKAEIVGALDADSFVEEDALMRMIPFFSKEKVVAVTPSMKIFKPKGFLQRIQYIEYLIGVLLRTVFTSLGSQHVTPGPFTMYKSDFFKKHGEYREAHMTEDIEMALRIQSKQLVIENSVTSFVYTVGPNTFKSLYRQRIRWYRGFVENVLDYKELFSRKHGNLGMFILPCSFISVALVIVSIVYYLVTLLDHWWHVFLNLKAVDFDIMKLRWFNFDLFYINLNAIAVLSFISLAMGITLIVLAKKIAEEKIHIKYSYILFMMVYWLLFGFWWIMSIGYKLAAKKQEWGHKSSA